MTLRQITCEALCVILLTFTGGYSIIQAETTLIKDTVNLTDIMLVHGGILFVFIGLGGDISGSHYNPLLSIAFFIIGEKSLIQTLAYIAVQLTSSLIGAFFIKLVQGEGYDTSYGYSKLHPKVEIYKGFMMEFFSSFVLIYVIFLSILKKHNLDVIAARTGVIVAVMICSFGSFGGACMNPARVFGPAIFDSSGDGFFRRGWWIYYTANVLGGVCGVLLAIFMARGDGKDEGNGDEKESVSVGRNDEQEGLSEGVVTRKPIDGFFEKSQRKIINR